MWDGVRPTTHGPFSELPLSVGGQFGVLQDRVDGCHLQKLREARHLTQVSLANVMGVSQSEISKIERRTDVYVSTLGSYVEAMGGRLDISAIFPDGGIVKINQFEGLGDGDEASVVKPSNINS